MTQHMKCDKNDLLDENSEHSITNLCKQWYELGIKEGTTKTDAKWLKYCIEFNEELKDYRYRIDGFDECDLKLDPVFIVDVIKELFDSYFTKEWEE